MRSVCLQNFSSLASKLREDFEVVMGPGQIFLTWIGWNQYFVAQVGSAIFGLGVENFP